MNAGQLTQQLSHMSTLNAQTATPHLMCWELIQIRNIMPAKVFKIILLYSAPLPAGTTTMALQMPMSFKTQTHYLLNARLIFHKS